jgi:hypothetical protein
MYERINKLGHAKRRLAQELGRDPTPEELAEELEMPLHQIHNLKRVAQRPLSLETPIGDEEDGHLEDFIEDEQTPPPLDTAIHQILQEKVSSVLTRNARAHPPDRGVGIAQAPPSATHTQAEGLCRLAGGRRLGLLPSLERRFFNLRVIWYHWPRIQGIRGFVFCARFRCQHRRHSQ